MWGEGVGVKSSGSGCEGLEWGRVEGAGSGSGVWFGEGGRVHGSKRSIS